MKVNFVKEPFFHLVVEESFSDSDSFFDEFDMLRERLQTAEQTGSDRHASGNSKKRGRGLFLGEEYQSLKMVSNLRELILNIGHSKEWKNDAFYRMYQETGWTSFLLNHYNRGDYYKPHWDDGLFTLITFFFDDYKNRIGGDLYFPEYNYLHKCKNNQSILFFSKELHQVTTFESDSNRCSISAFSSLWRRYEDPPINRNNLSKLNYSYK